MAIGFFFFRQRWATVGDIVVVVVVELDLCLCCNVFCRNGCIEKS